MDCDKLIKELDRLIDLLGILDPGTEKYSNVRKEIEQLDGLLIKDINGRNAEIDAKHKHELELKRLELEERKLRIEEQKLEMTAKENSEKEKLEKEKLEFQKKESEEKIRLEERKIENSEHEAKTQLRFTKKQAWGQLLQLPVRAGLMIVGIAFTHKVQETTLLDKTLTNLWIPTFKT